MNRIETIYNLIDKEDKVIDVGCDQAKLGIMLAKRKQNSIASDVSENVINRAKKDIAILELDEYIDLRVSDGLENIKENEADTLVLAGMGTHTMLEIISNTSLKFKKIITISNNYHDILRSKMNEYNYKVEKEQIIKENNKYYNLIMFKKGQGKYTKKEIHFGLNHIDEEKYKEYLEYLKNKYLKIQNESNGQNTKINELLELLNEK